MTHDFKDSEWFDSYIFHNPVLSEIRWARERGVEEEAIKAAIDRHNELCRERGVSEMEYPTKEGGA